MLCKWRGRAHIRSVFHNATCLCICVVFFFGVFLYLRICVFVYIDICIKIYRYLYIYLVQVVERAQIRQVIRNKACLCRPTFTHSFLFLFWQILWLHISFSSWFDGYHQLSVYAVLSCAQNNDTPTFCLLRTPGPRTPSADTMKSQNIPPWKRWKEIWQRKGKWQEKCRRKGCMRSFRGLRNCFARSAI